MNIVVVDTAADSGGALSILRGLHSYALKDTRHKWIFLLGKPHVAESENIKVVLIPQAKNSKIGRIMFDLVDGKKYVRSNHADIVINLQNLWVWGCGVPQIIYQDQPIPFQRIKKFSFMKPEERKLAFYQHIYGIFTKVATRKANGVVVQTQWMLDAVEHQCGVAKERVCLLPPYVDLSAIEHKEKGVDYRYDTFFYPASGGLYKNHECIYKACDILRKKRMPFTMSVTLNEGPCDNVNYVGQQKYADVLMRMKKSTLVFPSYIETYGLPLAEACGLGSIVLAADTPFAREILAEYDNAYFFEYDKPEQLAELMENVITKRIVREECLLTPVSCEDNTWERLIAFSENIAINLK